MRNLIDLFWKLDQRILEEFERFAHKFQRLTGRDNFWLGWAAFWGIAVFATLLLWINGPLTATYFIVTGGFVTVGWSLIASLERLKLAHFMGSWTFGSGTRNPMQIKVEVFTYRVLHFVSIPFIIVLLGGTEWANVLAFSQFAILLLYYFYSCTPLPPGTSKLSKIFSSIKSALTFTPAEPLPEGVPG